jgi:hypothetical protein
MNAPVCAGAMRDGVGRAQVTILSGSHEKHPKIVGKRRVCARDQEAGRAMQPLILHNCLGGFPG